jgi:hypothetical protein
MGVEIGEVLPFDVANYHMALDLLGTTSCFNAEELLSLRSGAFLEK